MSASEVLNDILQNIQTSQLNFSMNLTPFSAYITIRKSFTKNSNPPATVQPVGPVSQDVSRENVILKQQKEELLTKIEALEADHNSAKGTIVVLEDKISKIETSALTEGVMCVRRCQL